MARHGLQEAQTIIQVEPVEAHRGYRCTWNAKFSLNDSGIISVQAETLTNVRPLEPIIHMTLDRHVRKVESVLFIATVHDHGASLVLDMIGADSSL